MSIRGRIADKQLRQVKQKLIEGRRIAFGKSDWSAYETFVQQIDTLENKIKEGILSMILCRLEIQFETFDDSLNHYIEQEQTLATISKVLLQLIEEDNNTTFNEFKR